VLILLGFTGVLLLGTLLTWLWPGSLLWLLGAQYAQLGTLLWLAVLAAGNSALGGLLYSLNVNKGWIPPAGIVVPVDLLNQVVLCFAFDLSSVRGILLIGAIAPILPALINLAFGIQNLQRLTRPKFAQ
jgi:hypothetical protein